MRGPILGLGGAQVVVTTAVIGSIVSLFGLSMQVSLVIGMGLALSSTAIALKVIEEQGLNGTETGQSGFAVLLFKISPSYRCWLCYRFWLVNRM